MYKTVLFELYTLVRLKKNYRKSRFNKASKNFGSHNKLKKKNEPLSIAKICFNNKTLLSIAMRLTQTILIEADSFISPLKKRTLSLRNLELTSLDAIGILESSDINSVIDISQNHLSNIPAFPRLLRLDTLILSGNHIRTISGLTTLVNLEVLSVTFNEILYLSDLEELTEIKNLRALYLTGNPVTKNKHYRSWCIWRFPTLQVLDFERVKESERSHAKSTYDENSDLVNSVLSVRSHGKVTPKQESAEVAGLTEDDRKKLENDLEAADSLEEIQRIEEILLRGHF